MTKVFIEQPGKKYLAYRRLLYLCLNDLSLSWQEDVATHVAKGIIFPTCESVTPTAQWANITTDGGVRYFV